MENKDKFKIALSVACFAAISILVATQYRKHRKHKKQPQKTCYLKTDTKPQSEFKRVLADNSYSPFKHLNLNKDSSNANYSNLHPYKVEISALLNEKDCEIEFFDDNVDLGMRDSYVWVETESQLQELVEVLSKEKVLAVDTEQHSLRSFLGFTALIQISSQREDYLVDTIALHDVMGILRPVFSNPAVCKVFHGADNDVLWLQRDFHIYIVNLFDTAKACEVLSKPQKSLAYLLDKYCGISTNKLLQREDWRQRPLSEEMVLYARTDAHYLLFIANCLASELKKQSDENSSFLEASQRSNATCLQLFSKEIEAYPGESAASSMIFRLSNDQGCDSSITCDAKFQDLVRRLCAWRDLMARLHDESLRFVLSDQAIIALANKVPPTDTDIYNIIAEADLNVESQNLVSSFQSPSPLVCSHLEDFYDLFQDKGGKPDDFFQLILQRRLGPSGTCQLSIYNYALLSKPVQKLTFGLVSKQSGFKNAKQVTRKASRDLFVQKFSCKTPVYHNCRIYANDGRLLCYCDRRKLEWYLHRNLAKLVEENPPAIMLLFEPKGRPEDEGNAFYIQSKKNICVGCGEGTHYLRYRIIPSCYRVHFPEHLKSHRSHDIVLLCVDCHEVAHAASEKYKRQISAEFKIPLFVRKVVDSSQAQDISESSASVGDSNEAGVSPLLLRNAAMALLHHGPRMPPVRREELTEIVMKYYGGRELTAEDLEKALLVGMNPHEIRRLEKKKGFAFKHSSKNTVVGKQKKNKTGSEAASISSVDSGDAVDTIREDPFDTKNVNHLLTVDVGISSLSVDDQSFEVNGEVSDTEGKYVTVQRKQGSEVNCIPASDSDANSESSILSNQIVNSARTNSIKVGSPKHNPKLSLLEHGPHGKLVVDHLLKEQGEDGIRQFCQRWRHVFVDAVHPRFLPAGWDVMHSGRRDFGDFSVYNPSKRVTAAVVD